MRGSPKIIDPSAIRAMQSYDWPGNIRELRNIVERLLIMAPRDIVTADDVVPVSPFDTRDCNRHRRNAHRSATAAKQLATKDGR